MIETITTGDGSSTARHQLFGDLYHSDRGAKGEAQYVYIEKALFYFLSNSQKYDIYVFDLGLGAGLNAWLTLCNAPINKHITYYAIEKYPLSSEDQIQFHYSDSKLYKELLYAPWNGIIKLTEYFSICKIEADVLNFDFSLLHSIDVVYWDAFSPNNQPELWTKDAFSKIYNSMSLDGVLTTYSAKGTVKQAIRDAGFKLERLAGALGKHHMLRAIK